MSDDDVDAYVTDTMGYDSVDDAADEYGMDADTLREQVRRGLMVQRLQDSKVDSSALDDATVPDPPTAPDDGDVSTASAEYRDYILDLVGDAYDASTGTWADPEGTYALALSQYDLSGDTATYEAAEAAYAAALSLSQDAYSTSDDAWTDYVNGVLSRVTATTCAGLSADEARGWVLSNRFLSHDLELVDHITRDAITGPSCLLCPQDEPTR